MDEAAVRVHEPAVHVASSWCFCIGLVSPITCVSSCRFSEAFSEAYGRRTRGICIYMYMFVYVCRCQCVCACVYMYIYMYI